MPDTTDDKQPPSRSRLREAVLLVTSVVVALGFFEVGVRIIGVDYNPSAHWYYNADLGWTQEPNQTFTYQVADQTVHVAFNRLGFRDVDHEVRKPRGTKRLLIVGDSFSEAAQVNLEQTFFKILEDHLQSHTQGAWEAINLGVGDFGTAQELVALERFGLRYDPDLVLLQLFPLNDICNNTIELFELCKSENDRYRPYFVDDAGALRLTYAHPWRSLLRKQSVTFGLLEKLVLKAISPDDWITVESLRMGEMRARGYPEVDPLVNALRPSGNQITPVKQGWHMTAQILAQITARCQERGIALIAVVIPFEARVGDPEAAGDPYPEKQLSEIFEELNVPAVYMREAFDRNASLVLPYWNGHLNPEGHRLTAESIFALLLQLGLVTHD